MLDKDSLSSWITIAWVVGLSIWGGTVNYIYKVNKYHLTFSFFRFVGEITTAAFVGVITFLLCNASGLSLELTAALVGISGHMGTRALFLLEKKYEVYLGGGKDDEHQ